MNLDHYLWKTDLLFYVTFLSELSLILLSKYKLSIHYLLLISKEEIMG